MMLLFSNANCYQTDLLPKNMSVSEKKARFFTLVVPAVERVHNELQKQYEEVKQALENHTDREKIAALKKKYKVKTDRELLIALKPHPVSITIAQAAMESAWGTSRFFLKANNIFGVRSTSAKEPRVAAGEKTNGRTIWVRKYKSLDESIRHYYFVIATTPQYRDFKKMNYDKKPLSEIIQGLKEYSEIGDRYAKELLGIIRYNKLTKYDTKVAKQGI